MKIIIIILLLLLNLNFILTIFPSSYDLIDESNGFRVANNGGNVKCDMNGDGYDDLIQRVVGIGIYVYYGPLHINFPYPADHTMINGSNGFIYLNSATRTHEPACGDINNDGMDDLMFWINILPGQSHIIYGSNQIYSPASFSLLDGNNGFKIFALMDKTYNVAFGSNKAIGDFNGDGIKDIMVSTNIGAYQALGTHVFYVIFGIDGGKFPVNSEFAFDQSILDGSNGFTVYNIQNYNSKAADVNNDNIDDIVINRGQTALLVVYGKTQPFTSTYVPLFNGIDGNIFNIVGSSINSNHNTYGYGDFNGDKLFDLAVTVKAASFYYMLVIFGRKEYPASTNIGPNTFNGTDGIAILDNINPSTNSWGICPRIVDVNGDGYADIIASGGQKTRILFGNSFKYNGSVIFDTEILSGQCIGAQILNYFGFENTMGDYNGDGIDDIVIEGDRIVYGIKYIGSITVKNKLFLPNTQITNLIYKIFENNLESTLGICGIMRVTLTIENPIQGDYLFSESLIDSSIFSITPNEDSTSLTIGFIKRNDSYSIVEDALKFFSVSLVNSHSNKTISIEYGSADIQYIVVVGLPVVNCRSTCLEEGGICNDFTGCILNCTVNCNNGGSCNKSIGQCECLTGFEGIDCTGISCPSTCLNGSSCNTKIGSCECLLNFSGIDCSQQEEEEDEDDNKTNVGVIVGPILGGAAVIAAAISAFILLKRKKKNKKSKAPVELHQQPSMAQVFVGGKIENIDKF